MDLIKVETEETEGKVTDMVTHSKGGPGGCVQITTHEQFRRVKRKIGTGLIAANTAPTQHGGANSSKPEKDLKERVGENLDSKVVADETKKGEGQQEEEEEEGEQKDKSQYRSVYTSTGDLDVQTKKKMQHAKPKLKPKPALRRKVTTKKAQATPAESLKTTKQKVAAAYVIQRKGKRKANH